ncbi:MAG: DUF2469 family protein [Actinomycetota bacterium]
MSSEDLERYEAELELALLKEYRDVIGMFRFVVDTDRRSYLANEVVSHPSGDGTATEYELVDAWVWDMYRPSRFLARVRVRSYRNLTIEELPERDLSSGFDVTGPS